MRKVLLLILFLFGIMFLTACKQISQGEISFSKTSFNNFTYKEKPYFITNVEVSQNEIQKTLYKFYKLIIVDLDSEEVLSSSALNCATLAVNNIYQASDNSMCIGINDKYFKVLSKDFINTTESLNIQNFDKAVNNDDEFEIDKNDSRKIMYKGNVYNISNLSVNRNELGSYQSVLAEVRIFNPENGKSIPRAQLGKIDNCGSISMQNRVQWIYGKIYSIKANSIEEKFAIEINNEFKVAIKEGN